MYAQGRNVGKWMESGASELAPVPQTLFLFMILVEACTDTPQISTVVPALYDFRGAMARWSCNGGSHIIEGCMLWA